MGTVYLAEDQTLPGRLVALKETLDLSPNAQDQFRREAVILARLSHPRLPQVTDHFTDESGRQYLVMEYVRGDDLGQILAQRGPLPEAEALAYIIQVCEALEYMHTWVNPATNQPTPVIHRDIKPGNLKLTPQGQIRLVDFGLAKYQIGTGTLSETHAGSPGFSPPEQYSGGTEPRSDIYALGATLYCLLTRHIPPSSTAIATGTPLLPPRQINRTIRGRTEQIILRAMQIKVVDRYQSVREMRRALERVSGPVRRTPVWRWGTMLMALLIMAGLGGWIGRMWTPAPTEPAIATASPTMTASSEPTATATDVSALPATPDATGTTSDNETAVAPATPTVQPTPTVVSATASPTSAPPTATPDVVQTVEPSATPLPTRTPSQPATAPSAALTSTPPALSTRQPPATETPPAATVKVTLMEPADGTSSSDSVTFMWRPDGPLPPGQLFELIFWTYGNDPLVSGIGPNGTTRDLQTTVNFRSSGSLLGSPGTYQWGVRLVEAGHPVAMASDGEGRRFTYTSDGGEGGEGNGGKGGDGPSGP
jgi:serine/threonine protein kinase